MGRVYELIPPPITWRPGLTDIARNLEWQYAAGLNKDGSSKAKSAHSAARIKIIHKDRHGSKLRKMIPPPSNWRDDLNGNARVVAWRFAAGVKNNGNCRNLVAHIRARSNILRDERLRVIRLKDKAVWTPTDHKMLEKEKLRKSRELYHRKKHFAIPANRLKKNLQTSKIEQAHRKEQMKEVAKFISDNNINIDTRVFSDEDAFKYIVELMDDKTSSIGKDIFDALGMTLRESFWEGQFNGAIYALTTRGEADHKGSSAEYIRFIVNNYEGTTVLTQPGGEKFKFNDPEFKNLRSTFVPLCFCNTYASCTTMESAFQLLFHFLELGSQRLWLRSGQGCSDLALRKCDMKYIQQSGDKNPIFVCGITIVKNISVVGRTIDSEGKSVVDYITCGLGTKCKVNQPISFGRNCSESQEKALKTAQETLGPNYIDAKECGKRKIEFLSD